MPIAVLLEVDAETQSMLDALDNQLARIGGVQTIRQLGAPHHVSLAVYDTLPEGFEATLRNYSASQKPIAIELGYTGIFQGDEGVVFLGFAANLELIQAHRRFHAEFAAFDSACAPYYRIGAWVPHLTLAINAKGPARHAAIDIVDEHWKPRGAKLSAIGLIRHPPVTLLSRQTL